MRNFSSNGSSTPLCAASTGSMTMALKARRFLAQSGIEVTVKKLKTADSARGCIYGIEYPCALSGNVTSLLRRAGIEVNI